MSSSAKFLQQLCQHAKLLNVVSKHATGDAELADLLSTNEQVSSRLCANTKLLMTVACMPHTEFARLDPGLAEQLMKLSADPIYRNQLKTAIRSAIGGLSQPSVVCKIPPDFFCVIKWQPALLPPLQGGVSIPVEMFRAPMPSHYRKCERWNRNVGGVGGQVLSWLDCVTTTNPLKNANVEDVKALNVSDHFLRRIVQSRGFHQDQISVELDLGADKNVSKLWQPRLFFVRVMLYRKSITFEMAHNYGIRMTPYRNGWNQSKTERTSSEQFAMAFYVLQQNILQKDGDNTGVKTKFVLVPAWDKTPEIDLYPRKLPHTERISREASLDEEGREFAKQGWVETTKRYLTANPLCITNILGAAMCGNLHQFVQDLFGQGVHNMPGEHYVEELHSVLQSAYGGPSTANKKSKRKQNPLRRQLVRGLNSLRTATWHNQYEDPQSLRERVHLCLRCSTYNLCEKRQCGNSARLTIISSVAQLHPLIATWNLRCRRIELPFQCPVAAKIEETLSVGEKSFRVQTFSVSTDSDFSPLIKQAKRYLTDSRFIESYTENKNKRRCQGL